MRHGFRPFWHLRPYKFKESARRNDTALEARRPLEGGFARDALRPCVDQLGADARVFRPGGDESPAHRGEDAIRLQRHNLLRGPDVARRPRLRERLNAGPDRKLTLICAPAGFGKTTLISNWLAGRERPVAWLSLDEGENELARFLAYLVAALRTIVPTIGAGVVRALQSPQPPPTDALLATLLNDITSAPDRFVLVLDDYHVLDAASVDTALTFLLEHQPPQMHLVITTREDPRLPLARLRARGPIGRTARRRPADHPRRGRRVSERWDGPEPLDGGHRRAGDAHRGLDRRPAIGRTVDAGAERHRQLHRVLHRQPPFRAGLSGRGSPAPAVRKRPGILAAHVCPRPPVRTPV